MMHHEIQHVLWQQKNFTYGDPVVDYRPQMEKPNRIQITARGDLMTHESSPSVRTADLDRAKLHWNSVISTPWAQYMCLDINLFYLTAHLEYFKYMWMLLVLFPGWIQEQYNIKLLAYKGYVHLEMRRAVWGLPQAGILANKKLQCKFALFGCFRHVNIPGCMVHESRPISSTLLSTSLESNMSIRRMSII